MTENINVIETINEKSNNSRGLSFNEVGEFDTCEELIQQLESIGFELDDDELSELINKGYYDIDEEETDEVLIEDGRKKKFLLLEHVRDWTLFGDYCKHLIKDVSTNNSLFGFSAFGWPRIDGAIDLESGTVGRYYADTHEYKAVYKLMEDDICKLKESLNGEIDAVGGEDYAENIIDETAEIKRI